MSNPSNPAEYEAALRRELAGYEQAGNDDRAEQVRDELRRIGADVEAAEAGPRGRRAARKATAAPAAPQSTADGSTPPAAPQS